MCFLLKLFHYVSIIIFFPFTFYLCPTETRASWRKIEHFFLEGGSGLRSNKILLYFTLMTSRFLFLFAFHLYFSYRETASSFLNVTCLLLTA